MAPHTTPSAPRLTAQTRGALRLGLALHLVVALAGGGCAGEAIEPARAVNHPANPATAEGPFAMPRNTLEGPPDAQTGPPSSEAR